MDPTNDLETNGEPIASVLIVDDQSLLAGSLAMVLAAEGCSVRTLKPRSYDEFDAELDVVALALVLVRLHPGPRLADALELVRRSVAKQAPVAVLSDSTHTLLLAAAVSAGANGLISTSDLMADTVDQILSMIKGESWLSAERIVELQQQFALHRTDRDNRFLPFESLSRREGEVLMLLMEGHSVAKIAESSFVSVGTVRTQVKAILRKLGVNSQAAAVALAYRSGWPDSDPDLPVDLRLRSLD